MKIERVVGITSSAGDPDTLALTLLYAIPFAIVLMVRSNPKWMRIVGAASLCCYLVTIVDTGSRAAALAVILMIMLLLFRKPRNLFYLPVLIALAPLAWLVIPQQYKERYETVNHLKSDASYQNRLLSWEGGIAMFESNPITGIGAGDYTFANGEKYWPGIGHKVFLNAHSLYFKLLAELGLIGVFTFGGYLILVFRLNLRLRKELVACNASRFLQLLPDMLIIILLELLFDGYAAHNLYRDTWFVVGALTASISLLPVLRQTVPVAGSLPHGTNTQPAIDQEWSPALLPVLRK